ncbi:MAG: nucleoside deaminase [Pseudomonadota bacterium]
MSLFAPVMELALQEARSAQLRGEIPVGAVIVSETREVLARAGNRTRELRDPTAHAELLTIRDACARVGSERLVGCTLYVTLEPCAMCAGAIAAARIAKLCYGASDPKSGGVEQGARVFEQPQSHHRPEIIGGIREAECAELLREFFAERR